jgi:hypothetical protein
VSATMPDASVMSCLVTSPAKSNAFLTDSLNSGVGGSSAISLAPWRERAEPIPHPAEGRRVHLGNPLATCGLYKPFCELARPVPRAESFEVETNVRLDNSAEDVDLNRGVLVQTGVEELLERARRLP